MAKKIQAISPAEVELPTGAVGAATSRHQPAWECRLTKKVFPRAESVEQADWMLIEALRVYKKNDESVKAQELEKIIAEVER